MSSGDRLFELLLTLEDSFYFAERAARAKPVLVAEFERLTGHKLDYRGEQPINFLIDEAVGRFDAAARAWFEFVREYIWEPWLFGLIAEQRKQAAAGSSSRRADRNHKPDNTR